MAREYYTLYADINNGVMTFGDDDYVTETLDGWCFYQKLKNLGRDDYIKSTNVDTNLFIGIHREYGITTATERLLGCTKG